MSLRTPHSRLMGILARPAAAVALFFALFHTQGVFAMEIAGGWSTMALTSGGQLIVAVAEPHPGALVALGLVALAAVRLRAGR